jgi:integrase/recombinase XerD
MIRRFLVWLRTEYNPRRFNGDNQPLSPKTIRNVNVTLSSFFSWAATEFNIESPMDGVSTPKYKPAPANPFTRDKIEAMLDACELTRRADTSDRRQFRWRRATARRDRAIILMLLDTGLRASELCALKVGDVDIKTGRGEVKHGARGGAKGGKGRTVFLGKAARRFVWRYLAEREDGEDPETFLFSNRLDRPMNPDSLRQLLKYLADKADVKNCYPHRFRHTFASPICVRGGRFYATSAA